MNKFAVFLAMLFMSNSYSMNIVKTSEPQELSTVEQLPTELKIRILESVLLSNNLSQSLKNLNALARTSTTFAGLLRDSGVKTALAKRLINLPGTITQKKLLGTRLGIANALWYVNYMNSLISKFNKEFFSIIKTLNNEPDPRVNRALENLQRLAQQNIFLDVNSVDAYEIFQVAIYRRNEELFKLLLDAGFNINMESEGRTPLRTAIAAGTFEPGYCIKRLLEAGANVNGSNPNEKTPLILAAMIRDSGIVALLLDAGADVFAKRKISDDGKEYNALQAARYMQNKSTHPANYTATIELLKARMATILLKNNNDMYIDKEASKLEELSTIEQLPNELKTRIIESVLSLNNLSQALKNIHALARTSTTFAALLQDSGFKAALAKRLIHLPGTISQKKLLGTLLGVATEIWYVDYMNSLISTFNKEFLSKLQYLDMRRAGPVVESALKNLRSIARQNILLDVTSVDAYEIFVTAIYAGQYELISLLLDAGFNVNMEKEGITPLLAAIRSDAYPIIIKMLLKAGAHVNGSNNPNFRTPLIAATMIGNMSSAVSLLLDAGADIFAKQNLFFGDGKKYNALQAAEHMQNSFPSSAAEYTNTIIFLKVRMKNAFKERFLRAKQNYKPSRQIAANALQTFEESFNNSYTINVNNHNGYILFNDAIAQNNDEMMKLLIDADIDVNAAISIPFLVDAVMYSKPQDSQLLLTPS